MSKIPTNIDYFRIKAGMTVEELADKIDVERTHLQAMKSPTSKKKIFLHQLVAIAEAVGCQAYELIMPLDELKRYNAGGGRIDKDAMVYCLKMAKNISRELGIVSDLDQEAGWACDLLPTALKEQQDSKKITLSLPAAIRLLGLDSATPSPKDPKNSNIRKSAHRASS